MKYPLIRDILFKLEPEFASHLALKSLHWANRFGIIAESLAHHFTPIKLMGLQFPNRIGLAAGLDKNGEYIDALAALGFGFIEVGTVTPRPQSGNPKPRLFRLIENQALINRMGFNNKGVDYLIAKLKKTRYRGILGINIGKNKDTPIDTAIDDYTSAFIKVAPFASYVTINISSPNTEKLRELQHGDMLEKLLSALKQLQSVQAKYIPLVLKIAPDLSDSELANIAAILLDQKIDGVIATNTTLGRASVIGSAYAHEAGGLSGRPLLMQSTLVLQNLHRLLADKIPIIGCGGIFSADDGKQKLAAGAALLQLYTGLIYAGPQLVVELAELA